MKFSCSNSNEYLTFQIRTGFTKFIRLANGHLPISCATSYALYIIWWLFEESIIRTVGVEGEACICNGVNVNIRVVEVGLYFYLMESRNQTQVRSLGQSIFTSWAISLIHKWIFESFNWKSIIPVLMWSDFYCSWYSCNWLAMAQYLFTSTTLYKALREMLGNYIQYRNNRWRKRWLEDEGNFISFTPLPIMTGEL